jgi:hypothetical protein
MDEVEWLNREEDIELLSLALCQTGINLIVDMAVSSAIAWATNRRVNWSLMQQKLFEATTFAASYLPSMDFKQALERIMAALDRHCEFTKSLLIQAVVNRVCFVHFY